MTSASRVGPAILASVAVLANAALLAALGVGIGTQAIIWAVTAVLALAGAYAMQRVRPHFPDLLSFLLAAYCAGLTFFYLAGFVLLHRPIVTSIGVRGAAILSLAPLLVMAGVQTRRWMTNRPAPVATSAWPAAVLFALSLLLTAVTTYGHLNNDRKITLDQPGWSLSGPVPNWSVQSDRDTHIGTLPQATYAENFPPDRLNHRAWHIALVLHTVLTGEFTAQRAVAVYKAMTWVFYFALAYLSFAIALVVCRLSTSLATVAGLAVLVFSPLKLPLFALSPTYRGFFTASGTFYHNITQLTSVAVGTAGLYLVYLALRDRSLTFAWGCVLVSGSFFFKPSLFTAIAPALVITWLLTPGRLTPDRLKGIAALFAVPVLWVGYLALFRPNSALSRALDAPEEGETVASIVLRFQPMAGYANWLKDRFPEWIVDRPLLLFVVVAGFSLACFLPGLARAGVDLAREAWQHRATPWQWLQTRGLTMFVVGFYLAAMVSSTILAEISAETHNINFKWAFAFAYVGVLPFLIALIPTVRNRWLRAASWAMFAFQCAQGLGYVWYFFWYSRLL